MTTHREVLSLVVVAAMKMELSPLRRRALANLVMVETGIGVPNAECKLLDLLSQTTVRAVIGIGLAGALSPELKIGDLVVGKEVWGPSQLASSFQLVSVSKEVMLEGATIHMGTVITMNEMICSARKKEILANTLINSPIGCVDMESWGIARICDQHKIPYLVVRAISDGYDEDLPLDFNRYRRVDGNLNLFKLGVAALASPGLIADLYRLRRRGQLCAQRLAEFVEKLVLDKQV
jgi:adenosylhomocysteine nucleosidase